MTNPVTGQSVARSNNAGIAASTATYMPKLVSLSAEQAANPSQLRNHGVGTQRALNSYMPTLKQTVRFLILRAVFAAFSAGCAHHMPVQTQNAEEVQLDVAEGQQE